MVILCIFLLQFADTLYVRTPPPSGPPTALSSPPELPVPLEIPQQTKLTWRTVYPKLGRIKKKEMLPVTTTPNPRK